MEDEGHRTSRAERRPGTVSKRGCDSSDGDNGYSHVLDPGAGIAQLAGCSDGLESVLMDHLDVGLPWLLGDGLGRF